MGRLRIGRELPEIRPARRRMARSRDSCGAISYIGQMILQRFYDDKLAQASYLIGCSATGEALVIDPLRDVEPYLAAAQREGLRITDVTETHIHADFVSGARELAARTEARLHLSAEGGPDWQYGYAAEDEAHLLRDGDRFDVGNVRVDVVHTPGHTPEHLTFVITDGAAADQPIGAVTGDFLFVGDVGRPDLLEKAAGVGGTMDAAARALFQSLGRFRARYPEWLQIWPGHGAGSACGKGLSSIPHSTLGYEQRFNWAFSMKDEDEFVRTVLAGQPEPPKYFAEMKRINRSGPRVLGALPQPARMEANRLDALRSGAVVVDTRTAAAFAESHVPGTISIPLNRSFTKWAGALLPYDADLVLITSDAGAAQQAARDLAIIGLDRVRGFLTADAIHTWASSGGRTERMQQMTVEQLAARASKVTIIDVRARSEYDAGHLPGTTNIPLPELRDRISEIPDNAPVVLHCQGGGRSAIATSVLQAKGHRNVSNLVGGYSAWARAGLATEAEK